MGAAIVIAPEYKLAGAGCRSRDAPGARRGELRCSPTADNRFWTQPGDLML